MAGEAVDEVVLAAVGLVGDDDDVAAVGEQPGAGARPCSGRNFWMVVKTTPPEATRSFARRSARLSAWTGGWRSSSWQRAKVLEELVVEVVAVGHDDDGGVLHGRVEDDAARRRRPW